MNFTANYFVAINKESGISSGKVVGNIKKIINNKEIKVGHTGTLDPLACGVIIIATGEATKFSEYVLTKDKEYFVKCAFGKETDTNDSDGKVIETQEPKDFESFDNEKLDSFLNNTLNKEFVGNIDQYPPKYSAIKIKGRKLYDYARKNIHVDIPLRNVNVHYFKFLRKENNEYHFYIKCSKGTYIRSLIRDLGYHLNTFGCVTFLQRTKVGLVSLDNSIDINDFDNHYDSKTPIEGVKGFYKIEEMLPTELSKISVSKEIAKRLLYGQRIVSSDISSLKDKEDQDFQVFFENIFIGVSSYADNLLHPKRMIKTKYLPELF